MATNYGLTVYFDSGIETVSFQYGSNEYTFINSGAIYGFSLEPGSDIVLTVNLKAGYSLESSSFGTVNGNTVTIAEENMTANMTCTLTSKSSTPRLSVDVSTLAGWANLSAGSHNITIVAKAAGFKDSAPSTAVSVTKAAVDNGVMTDKPAYTFNVDFNVAPGQNVSETSNQAYEAVQNYINETGGSSEYAILDALDAISSGLGDEFASVLEFGDNIKNRIRDIGDLQVPSDGNVTCACDVNAVYFAVYNNGSWTVAIPTSSTEGWQTHLSSTGSTPIIIVTFTQ